MSFGFYAAACFRAAVPPTIDGDYLKLLPNTPVDSTTKPICKCRSLVRRIGETVGLNFLIGRRPNHNTNVLQFPYGLFKFPNLHFSLSFLEVGHVPFSKLSYEAW